MKRFEKVTGVVLALLLAGCQTPPPGKFTPQQTNAMRSQGFSEVSEGWMLGMSDTILFGKNKADLMPESIVAIKGMAAKLASFGLLHARLDGHTDNYGDGHYNKTLSLRRANVVADAWAEGAGVPRTNITTRGLGDEVPVQSNKSPQGRAENRRVAVVITAP